MRRKRVMISGRTPRVRLSAWVGVVQALAGAGRVVDCKCQLTEVVHVIAVRTVNPFLDSAILVYDCKNFVGW